LINQSLIPSTLVSYSRWTLCVW